MPETKTDETALPFAEATSPEVLAMFGGEVKETHPGMLVISFGDMSSAASWARTADLEAQTWINRMYAGFDSVVHVDVMDPES